MNTTSRSKWMRALFAAGTLGLAALFVQAQTVNADLQKKFDTIVERLGAAHQEFEKSLSEAKDATEHRKLWDNRPGAQFIPEFQAIAREAKGSELAAKAWMRVTAIAADIGRKDGVVEAIDTLIADHVASSTLEPLPNLIAGRLTQLIGKEKSEATLRTLAEKSPHKSIQAAALFSVASAILDDDEPAPERAAEARKLMERIRKDYAGLKSSRQQDYAALAEATLFELDHLQIGKVAPDFEVTDENGVKFKLSDYRGKVVVIDFWGNW